MASSYSAKFVVDNEEVERRLDGLAAGFNLTKFTKVAVEFYLSTPEGKRLCDSLSTAVGTQRRSRKKAPRVGTQQYSQQAVSKSPQPVGHVVQTVGPLADVQPTASGLDRDTHVAVGGVVAEHPVIPDKLPEIAIPSTGTIVQSMLTKTIR